MSYSVFCGFDNGFGSVMNGIAIVIRREGFRGRVTVTDFDPDSSRVYFNTDPEIPQDYLISARREGFYIECDQ